DANELIVGTQIAALRHRIAGRWRAAAVDESDEERRGRKQAHARSVEGESLAGPLLRELRQRSRAVLRLHRKALDMLDEPRALLGSGSAKRDVLEIRIRDTAALRLAQQQEDVVAAGRGRAEGDEVRIDRAIEPLGLAAVVDGGGQGGAHATHVHRAWADLKV